MEISDLKDNKDEAELIIESLVEFLIPPVNKQYHMILAEVFARSSTK